jgi:hypothetical protein
MPGPVTRSLLGLEAGILGKFKLSAFAQNNCAHYEFRIDISECQTFNLIRIIHNVNPSRATTLGFGSINEAKKKYTSILIGCQKCWDQSLVLLIHYS